MEYEITYEGHLRTSCVHFGNKKVLLTDAPMDNQGKGEEFSPTDLVAVALGTCVLTIMGIHANRLGVDIDGAKAWVKKEMTNKPVRRLQRIQVTVECPPLDDLELREKLEKGGMGCPVHYSLHPDVKQEIKFIWKES